MSYAGLKPSFTSATTTAAMTAGTGITVPTGDIVATLGNLTLPTTSATVGQIILNGSRIIHQFGANGNDFFGTDAGNFTLTVATAVRNVALGSNCLQSLTTGADNASLGVNSLFFVSSGGGNVAIGTGAGGAITTGNNNIAIGRSAGVSGALTSLTTGSNNIAIGPTAGNGYTGAEESNIAIGALGTTGESNKIRIGTAGSGSGQQNACFIAGIFGATVGGSGIPVNVDNAGQLGTVVSSIRFKENIHNIEKSELLKLRPVTFTYKTSEDKSKHYGLIAEEVEQVMPDLVVYDDKNQPMSVKYHELPAILLAEIQKLSKRIELLENKA